MNNNEARLYINNEEQPWLIAKELKQPFMPGGIAFWIGVGTEGYFRGLDVKGFTD